MLSAVEPGLGSGSGAALDQGFCLGLGFEGQGRVQFVVKRHRWILSGSNNLFLQLLLSRNIAAEREQKAEQIRRSFALRSAQLCQNVVDTPSML